MMQNTSKKKPHGGNSASTANSSRCSSGETQRVDSASTSVTSLSSSQGTMKSLMPDPESITGYDLRAHLKQILTFSDDEDDLSSEGDCSLNSIEESFEVDDQVEAELQKLMDGPASRDQPATPKPTTGEPGTSLLAIAEEDDLSSEEENEIMKEIKNEITNNLRGEMKSELDLYKYKLEKLEREAGGEGKSGEGNKKGAIYEGLDELEPKLREAIIKMRKLDKILTKRVRREKEVKRDRILLERRIRKEIEELHHEKPDEYKEVQANEQKYLSLELPQRHNEESLTMIQNDSYTDTSDQSDSVSYDTESESVYEAQTLNHSETKSLSVSETHTSNLSETEYLSVTKTQTSNHSETSLPCHNSTLVSLDKLKPFVSQCWLSPSPNELKYLPGVTIPDEFTGEEVFATQLNEDEYPGLQSHRSGKHGKGHAGSSQNDDNQKGTKGGESESQADTESFASGSRASGSRASGSTRDRKHRKKGKDFIKRNKELAADASNMIAMTEEEKKRLEDLLTDVDTLAEVPDQLGDLDESNPFQIAIKPGEGFHPEQDELQSLTSIDSRLRDLMPPEDYESIASSSVLSHVPKHKLFTHTGVKHSIDWAVRGERALFQNAEQREMNERILAIDSELSRIKNPEDELETPRLDEDQMRDLVQQCVSSLSQTSFSRQTLNTHSRSSMADTESVISHQVIGDSESEMDYASRSPRSARQEILDNPPKLDPLVLQKLLSEAYHPLSKQLTTLREENEDDDAGTPIPADVWKLISEEKLDEEEHEDKSNKRIENGPSLAETLDKTDKNQLASRNGLSRASSVSSNASTIEAGKQTVKEREPLKLPDIDPTGTMVTQGLNNHRNNNQGNQSRLGSGSSRTPIHMVRNSFSDVNVDQSHSDSRLEILSLDGGDFMSPHPPKYDRRESSGGKSRTVTPASTRSMAT